MTLVEIIPEAKTLSRSDKSRLIQVLTDELELPEEPIIEPNRLYLTFSPDREFLAADTMLQALCQDRGQ